MTVTISRSAHTCPRSLTRRTLWSRFAAMFAVSRQRRALRDLDEHLLEDIGITRKDATIEAEKPVWDVPTYWSK